MCIIASLQAPPSSSMFTQAASFQQLSFPDNQKRGCDMFCTSRRKVTAALVLGAVGFWPTSVAARSQAVTPPTLDPQSHTFTLRHIFHRGTYQDPDLHRRLDVQSDATFSTTFDDEATIASEPPRLIVRSRPIHIERLADRRVATVEEHLQYAGYTGMPRRLDASEWVLDDVPAPNVTDKDTVINLAIMAANAYVPKYGEGEWEDVSQKFNKSVSFGWEGDGLRGHIFADEKNETVVVGLKGTSPAVFDGDGTTTRDKLNDNLFFSCCCAQGGQYFWRQVCDCQHSTYSCNSTCLVKSLKDRTRYYTAAIDLYTNVTELYPHANIWIVGHSLGGAVSALLGLTFGLPVVTYEAPGDALAAQRLGLPAPQHAYARNAHQQANTGAFHFGHTADPIFMGVCNGATSPCTLGGYAMESQCHTGNVCIYDTVADKGWRVGLGYHRIHDVIDNVIRKYDQLPSCVPDNECVDCYNWKFFKSNGSDHKPPKSTTTKISTRTRTETCKTPGWWGCLDKSTSSSPVATTTYTTTTCISQGWFGCRVEANTTITTTTAIATTTSVSTSTTSTSTSTTSCKTPGFFFGCDDEPTTKHHPHHSASKTAEPTTSCETPGLFFGCHDKTKTSATLSHSITSKPTSTPVATSVPASSYTRKPKHKKCKHPAFFGLICLDSTEHLESIENELR